jgi:SAM-dependent methyltransferase
MTPTAEELREFYEDGYRTGIDGETFGRWRDLNAATKANHVVDLAHAAGLHVRSVADIGCGDGAVLGHLGARGFGEARVGYEISGAATALAAERVGVTEAHVFDGSSVPVPDGTYDLAIASHVIEHVLSPCALLREMARIARSVIIEVPLEANLSASRASARAASREAGHIHRFSQRDVRRLVSDAGLEVRAELRDTLPLSVYLLARTSAAARLMAIAKWGIRAIVVRIPFVADRLITLHYALAATPEIAGQRMLDELATSRSRHESARRSRR